MPITTGVGTAFTLFPNLPYELRQKIWRVCSKTRRSWSYDPLYCQPSRALLARVCKQSREVAFRLSFDPSTIIHYVSEDKFALFSQTFRDRDPTGRPHEIRHLAVAFVKANSNLNWALSRMPNLETLSVVFPRARDGRIDRDTLVQTLLGRRENARLVELPPVLLKDTQLVAGRLFTGWYGDPRPPGERLSYEEDQCTGWIRTIEEYLPIVENAIVKHATVPSTSLLGAYGIPAVWDREGKVLKLKIQARHFIRED
ncbi:hypothetical protein BX600DRAFT_457230 [Xylariales sp. PMI_506]|nr:hypothetical protein BX600DRAFT_457230 [Xylariales sp. PMI_506]